MRVNEVGQQLRAYRLETGLKAEDIAAQLGVSRAALYRYEKGEVIKLDTIQRMAELLKVSPLSLLGIGVEYYSRPVAFFERMRQMEETADQILEIAGPLCYLTTSDTYDAALAEAFEAGAPAADRAAARKSAEQVIQLLAERKRMYRQRRPGIIGMLSAARLRALLRDGVAPGVALPDRTRAMCRQVAAAEVEHVASLMEAEPMGLQFGLLDPGEPAGGFAILRGRDRATLAANPCRADTQPGETLGVAMITAAEDALAAHQRVAEAQWRAAAKGSAGAAQVRALLAEARAGA